MAAAEPLHDLELLIRSRHGLIVMDSDEEERIETLIRLVADRLSLPLFTWSRARGLRRDGNQNAVYGTAEPDQALSHIASAGIGALYLLSGVGPLLASDVHAEQIKELARSYGDRPGAVILAGAGLDLPPSLSRLGATVRMPGPDAAEYGSLIDHLMRDLGRSMNAQLQLSPADRARLIGHLQGLTLIEAEKILTKAIVEDGRLTAADIQHVVDAKRRIVEREGVLEYYPLEESMDQVADLAGLKDWLRKRSQLIHDRDAAEKFGLSFPKGVLLIGVPGCGKSLCAKAVAMEWKLPLLKLDPGSLYNKYIGETEKNFKRAMDCAERLAPCVLFIDELEKAFAAGGSEDGGVSKRVLGSFLSWLQDRRSDVFTVATANDVSSLPPEFLRKGRFDEIFFVDLPGADARRAIFEIHLAKRDQDLQAVDLDALTGATDGFSGAEIEQAIVSTLYTAFADGGRLSTDLLLAETRATSPLSRVMAERIHALREWARGRTVLAN